MIALFDTSDASVISSRRYPGHWCRLFLSLLSIGDAMWRSRKLDEDKEKRSRQSSKCRLTDSKLWFFEPRSSHHTSRRGVRCGFGFSDELKNFFFLSWISETFEVPSASYKGALGKPSSFLSYASNSRSGESPVDIQCLDKLRTPSWIEYLPYRIELAPENSWNSSHAELWIYHTTKITNLLTETRQYFYATSVYLIVKSLGYRTIFMNGTWWIKWYNRFIIIAGKNTEVLSLKVKKQSVV